MIASVDIAFLQHIHGPGVHRSDAVLLGAFFFQQFLHVGAAGHPGGRQRAPNQHFFRMNGQPSIFVLVHEAILLEDGPGFFERDSLHAIEDVVRYLWAAVGTTLAVPIRPVLDDIFSGEEPLLRADGR